MTDKLSDKVHAVLEPLLGGATDRLSGRSLHRDVIARIRRAHTDELGHDDASRLGMHMSDWIGDASFLLALHLDPDAFDDDEIRDGVGQFLGHAPSHIVAACKLTGETVWDEFPDDDPSTWENPS